jgi:hypothetical protein
MTYLGGFIIIGVKGLFHSDWLGAGLAESPIGSELGEGKMGKSSNPALHYRCELLALLAGFLDSAQAELSPDTRLPAVQLLHSQGDLGQIPSNC